jgi:hypothetical protein
MAIFVSEETSVIQANRKNTTSLIFLILIWDIIGQILYSVVTVFRLYSGHLSRFHTLNVLPDSSTS